MKKLLSIIITTAIIGLSTEAVAVELISGPSCKEWSYPANGSYRSMYDAYLYGFISGAAYGKNIDVLKNRDGNSLLQFMNSYCADHQTDSVADGSRAIFAFLTMKFNAKATQR